MAQHKQANRQKPEEVQEAGHHKKKAQQPAYDQLKARDEGIADFQVEASLERHADMLAKVHSDEQRASLVTRLQQSHGNAYVQQLVERIQAEKGSGKPLDSETRSEMEAVFKQDFGDVRIHTDTAADKLAKGLGAKAFTSGKDIFFREGTYQPASEEGEKLLGHELTHVVQQESGIGGGDMIGRAGDALEQEATWVGQLVSEGHPVSIGMASAVPALQREAVTTAEAQAPEARAGVDTARLAALKAMFEAAVVGPMRKSYEVLGGDKPDAQAGFNHLQTSYEVLCSMIPSYKGVEPMYSRLIALGNMVNVWAAQLRPHIGETAIPLSQIREDLNPDKNTILEAIRSQF